MTNLILNSGNDRKTNKDFFFFLIFLFYNYLIWLLERTKYNYQMKQKKKGNCTSVYLTYLPHGSAHSRDKENGSANSKLQ